MAGWSLLQLTEYFSAITRAGDVHAAARIAVQRASESTDAEVAAVVSGGVVLSSVGLGRHGDPAVFTSLPAGAETATFPGLGPMFLTTHALDRDGGDLLIVARADEPFVAEERQMLQGMSRVLGLAMRSLRTLEIERRLRHEKEREAEARLALLEALERRERLLETLLRVQRSANQGTPLTEVLDAVTEGARSLLGNVTAALVLRDVRNPGRLTLASLSHGADGRRAGREAVLAAARRAMTAGRPVSDGDVAAAPVHVGDGVAGGFVIAVDRASDHQGEPGLTGADAAGADDVRASERRDVLAAFAEQASLALTGAHTLAAVHEARHDPLTRLPNRALLLQRVERVLA
ncbi:MAG: diguanylate phosphodiesterase, partial [Actinoplanes sp.]